MNWTFDEKMWHEATERSLRFIPQALTGIGLFLAFWLVAVIVYRVIYRIGQSKSVHSDVLIVFARSIKITLVTIGVVTALGTLGVNVTALVTGLGITGIAVSFALKDIISNLLAGLLLLFYRPFQKRDHISVIFTGTTAGLEGTVSQIDLRYTTLELPDRKILVPNAILFTNAIVVFHPPAEAEKN